MDGPLTPAGCREALKAVIDPEIYQNIVDLGLVYGIDVRDDRRVDVTMTLTTPHCPMGPQILHDVEQTLLARGAASVDVRIVWEPMWTPDAMADDLKRELGLLVDDEAESMLDVELPPPLPPPPRKRSFFGRLFGRA